MKVDKLKLLENKTEFIMTGTRAQLNKVKLSQLTIGHASVSTVVLSEILDLRLNVISVWQRVLTNPVKPCYNICIISVVLESF